MRCLIKSQQKKYNTINSHNFSYLFGFRKNKLTSNYQQRFALTITTTNNNNTNQKKQKKQQTAKKDKFCFKYYCVHLSLENNLSIYIYFHMCFDQRFDFTSLFLFFLC